MNEKRVEKASVLLKALSEPSRLSIVYLLSFGELNVSRIADKVGMKQSAVSHQLKLLKSARIVKVKKVGQKRVYSLLDNHIYELLKQVMTHVEEKESENDPV